VRENVDGTLYLLVYGDAIAVHVDPIEKKPLFHFMPGAQALSIGTYGCNFHCPFCQNWQISQTGASGQRGGSSRGRYVPEALVEACLHDHIPVIAYTYNEPTVFFEYTYDTAKLAHEHGIKNVYVSNGFMSRAAIDMIAPYLDGINVDLKAFTEDFYREQCQGRLAPVKRNIAYLAREKSIWVEVTTLLVPGLNDSEEELRALAGWMAGIEPDMPWHISAFHPDYQMRDRPPTPTNAMLRAYEIGKEAGLRHVYVGNVMDTDRGSTYCSHCGERLVERRWYSVRERWPQRGVCARCGEPIPGAWS
jgi:pyruvate formate lyase activating enzyme